MIEVFARSTKKIQQGFRGRLKAFGKNLLLGNDEKLQDLLTNLERLTRSEDRLASAETLVRAKQTGADVGALKRSASKQSSVLTDIRQSTDKASHVAISVAMNHY